jgi:serine phosphatase RsbU (regulator of sigma subunit)
MTQFEVSIAHGHRSPAEESRRGGDFSLAGDFLSAALALMFHRTIGVVRSPADLLERLNNGLLYCTGSMAPSEKFGTAFAATVDRRAASLTFAAAGAEAALLLRSDGSHEHLGPTGPLLGLDRSASYADCVLPFGPGDAILAFTDGVTEARSATSDEFFGTSGLARCLRRAQLHGESICATLLDELDTFTGKRYRDDVTIAALEARRPSQARNYAGSSASVIAASSLSMLPSRMWRLASAGLSSSSNLPIRTARHAGGRFT